MVQKQGIIKALQFLSYLRNKDDGRVILFSFKLNLNSFKKKFLDEQYAEVIYYY